MYILLSVICTILSNIHLFGDRVPPVEKIVYQTKLFFLHSIEKSSNSTKINEYCSGVIRNWRLGVPHSSFVRDS